jgi:mono/diheme cytochrome c family protein
LAPSPRAERTRRSALPRLGLALALFVAAAAPRAGAASEPAAAPLAFARHAEPVATRSLAWLREAVPASVVRVHEPYEAREVAFEALPFDRVLDAIYTPSWRSEEEILFTCRDGYQPTVPVGRVLAHRAWLAFRRADQPDFAIRKPESGTLLETELGPFYLVWENLDDAAVRREGDYGWPYQLVGVELIRARDRFPAMTPPPGSPPDVLAGFAAFRVHCSRCHKLNGEGGGIGPELNAGASPLEYRDQDWLRAWIEDPARIRPGTRMPPLDPLLPDRAATADRILAYLHAMVTARSDPAGR